eukprot:7411033-Pyramimonas_sp.AAC.1
MLLLNIHVPRGASQLPFLVRGQHANKVELRAPQHSHHQPRGLRRPLLRGHLGHIWGAHEGV